MGSSQRTSRSKPRPLPKNELIFVANDIAHGPNGRNRRSAAEIREIRSQLVRHGKRKKAMAAQKLADAMVELAQSDHHSLQLPNPVDNFCPSCSFPYPGGKARLPANSSITPDSCPRCSNSWGIWDAVGPAEKDRFRVFPILNSLEMLEMLNAYISRPPSKNSNWQLQAFSKPMIYSVLATSPTYYVPGQDISRPGGALFGFFDGVITPSFFELKHQAIQALHERLSRVTQDDLATIGTAIIMLAQIDGITRREQDAYLHLRGLHQLALQFGGIDALPQHISLIASYLSNKAAIVSSLPPPFPPPLLNLPPPRSWLMHSSHSEPAPPYTRTILSTFRTELLSLWSSIRRLLAYRTYCQRPAFDSPTFSSLSISSTSSLSSTENPGPDAESYEFSNDYLFNTEASIVTYLHDAALPHSSWSAAEECAMLAGVLVLHAAYYVVSNQCSVTVVLWSRLKARLLSLSPPNSSSSLSPPRHSSHHDPAADGDMDSMLQHIPSEILLYVLLVASDSPKEAPDTLKFRPWFLARLGECAIRLGIETWEDAWNRISCMPMSDEMTSTTFPSVLAEALGYCRHRRRAVSEMSSEMLIPPPLVGGVGYNSA
ncbi:MAG: hypothetical protein Q9227_001091 [Pyrenula ochraceoflavens]